MLRVYKLNLGMQVKTRVSYGCRSQQALTEAQNLYKFIWISGSSFGIAGAGRNLLKFLTK